jgi:hypothetical protein
MCSVATGVSMKTYDYAKLSEAERVAVCERPRIDVSSIMAIVCLSEAPPLVLLDYLE